MAAPAATGLQGIEHAAGLRNVPIDSGAPATPLHNANGKPLGFTPLDGAGMADPFTAGAHGDARRPDAAPTPPRHRGATPVA